MRFPAYAALIVGPPDQPDTTLAQLPTSIWVFPKIGIPQNKWFIMENPIKMDDLGVMNLHHCFMSCVPCDELLPVRFEICPFVWYQHLRQLQWKTLRRITGCSVSVVCGSGSLG